MRRMAIDKLIKVSTTNTNNIGAKGTDFENLKRRMKGICISLNYSAEQYDPKKTISSIKKYLKECNRIIYSEISGYFFSLDESQRANFISNVECLLVTCMSDASLDNSIQQSVLKIYDHVHLAIHQVEKLQYSTKEESLEKIFATNIEPIKVKLEEKIEKTYKELYGQLIALIAIFTAMAFLVFGSMSSLDNIFNQFTSTPLLKIVIVVCVWGLFIINLIYIFLIFVSRMTRLGVPDNNYSLAAWSNLILITILLASSWGYYIKKIGITLWFEILVKSNEVFASIAGFVVIIIIFAVSLAVIIRNYSKHNDL